VGPLSSRNDYPGAIAEAFEWCTVRVKPGILTSFSDAEVCSLLTHEWGHLAGRRFPGNTADPSHSPDSNDNMYGPFLVHHPACGESDQARALRQARAAWAMEHRLADLAERREVIAEQLSGLKDRLRATKVAKRRAHGAKRARYARRIKRLRVRIAHLRAEYRSFAGPATWRATVALQMSRADRPFG
jgi:hypothetical protein